MASVYCSQGHANSAGGRFCSLCGEKLNPSMQQGLVLGQRYRVVKELGRGGFGRTYLAEDINRFSEACVLKEFAPQVQGTYALQKAEELFAREAGVLYTLQHPQIPRFRELFRARFEEQDHLFLVQDYVEGQTYRQLLDARRREGLGFSEFEVKQLLLNILPVLHYIHSAGVIHRDISPDNLILRAADQLPVLIDFGGVKQVAVEASHFMASGAIAPMPTRLGKVGYAPDEQMQLGDVFPHSDLYALAVTGLVLLLGKEPQDIVGNSTSPYPWQTTATLSPGLTAILSRMLAPSPRDRYPSAEDVLQALSPTRPTPPPSVYPPVPPVSVPPNGAPADPNLLYPPTTPTFPHHPDPHTLAAAANAPTPAVPAVSAVAAPTPGHKLGYLVVLLLLLGSAVTGWWTRDRWLPLIAGTPPGVEPGVDPGTGDTPNLPPNEQIRKDNLRNRRQALGVDYQFWVNLTNATFYENYPEQQGRALSDGPEDAEWRARWDAIAGDWLTLFQDELSTTARTNLGNYTRSDRDRWRQEANQLYVSSRALHDLTDAQFFHLFPERQGQEVPMEEPIGQVWQAIAADRLQALKSGTALEQVQFQTDQFSQQVQDTLAPGAGKVYIVNLTEGQILRLNLRAAPQATLLSLYLPRPTQELPFLLEDTEQTTWTGQLPQSGFYEIVIVSSAPETFDYRLNVAVDNVTSTPVTPATPEAPSAKD